MFLTENVTEAVVATVQSAAGKISVVESLIYGVLGYAVVFFGLILLMLVIVVVGRAFTAKAKAPEQSTVAPAPAAAAPLAPGSAGELKLHDVEPKTAAMVMAIVADKLGKPLNELRFKSIKEVK